MIPYIIRVDVVTTTYALAVALRDSVSHRQTTSVPRTLMIVAKNETFER
mgnify:CR=1 FL=1